MAAGRKTGGRVKGSVNKLTADIKALAAQYAPAAVAELGRLATTAENPAARVAACKELLDRAYGKAPQSVDMNLSAKLTLEQLVAQALK